MYLYYRGAVPYLNDSYLSYLNLPSQCILFGELINYLDIFLQFSKHQQSLSSSDGSTNLNLLSLYFNISTPILGFTEYTDNFGNSNEHEYFLQSTTGKKTLTSSEYFKYINVFNPAYSYIPFEYLPPSCGKKRVQRCYHKVSLIYNYISTHQHELAHHNFILPIFTKHINDTPLNDINTYLQHSKGLLVFTEHVSELNFKLLLKYKSTLNTFGENVMKIKANGNNVLDVFIGMLIGCTHVEVEFPFTYSEKGLCLCVDFSTFHKEEDYRCDSNTDDAKFDYAPKLIDFNKKEYEEDLNVIVSTCECFVCKSGYKRAYIHHLYKCHELNGNILVTIHNLYQSRKIYELLKQMRTQEEQMNCLCWFIKYNCISNNNNKK